jgi:hypothetical protein
MACLRELGLVNLRRPRDSTVLGWIGRATPSSPLITEQVIQAEYDGFLEWIEHSAACGRYECEGVTCGPERSEAFCQNELEPSESGAAALDEGGCGDRQLERLFRDSVYASRGRCFPCHFNGENGAVPDAPRFIEQTTTCDASSLATMRNVVAAGLIDVADPAASLLLTKPLALDRGGVEHGGHDKFYGETDPAYQNFSYWIGRYAACQRGSRQ